MIDKKECALNLMQHFGMVCDEHYYAGDVEFIADVKNGDNSFYGKIFNSLDEPILEMFYTKSSAGYAMKITGRDSDIEKVGRYSQAVLDMDNGDTRAIDRFCEALAHTSIYLDELETLVDKGIIYLTGKNSFGRYSMFDFINGAKVVPTLELLGEKDILAIVNDHIVLMRDLSRSIQRYFHTMGSISGSHLEMKPH